MDYTRKKFDGDTNNEVELQVLISEVKLCKRLGFWHISIEFESALVTGWLTKKSCMAWYLRDYWDDL